MVSLFSRYSGGANRVFDHQRADKPIWQPRGDDAARVNPDVKQSHGRGAICSVAAAGRQCSNEKDMQ